MSGSASLCPSNENKDSAKGLTVSIPKDRLIAAQDKDTRAFFAVLQSTHTYDDLTKAAKAKFRPMSKFSDMLQTYLSIVSDRLEELYPEASDDEFRGAVDWVVLQGHDMVQALLDVQDSDAFKQDPKFWTEPGQTLRVASGHWIKQ